MMLCKNGGKEVEIVGFSRAENVCKFFCFHVLLGSLLLVLASLASNMHN